MRFVLLMKSSGRQRVKTLDIMLARAADRLLMKVLSATNCTPFFVHKSHFFV